MEHTQKKEKKNRKKLIAIVVDNTTLELVQTYQQKLKNYSGKTYDYNNIIKAIIQSYKTIKPFITNYFF